MPRPGVLRKIALRELGGVGDWKLGQWEEFTGRAFHLRRRLSDAESKIVGPLRDIRGTEEAVRLLEPLRPLLPPGWSE